MISKAVFPVAGLGTRFLPATKANPKEMLPIVDKPLIQYAVEEAVEAGITELIFVTSSTKRAIEDHFDTHYELEQHLAQTNKNQLLDLVQNIVPHGVTCIYVRQAQSLGLGHAVLCAQKVVGEEPFAVLLADDLIDAKPGCMKQMVSFYNRYPDPLVAVQPIQACETRQYGVIDIPKGWHAGDPVIGIVEKPQPEVSPSLWGVVGRYILNPSIFEFLRRTRAGSGGEIQLTDALQLQQGATCLRAFSFSGTRYDCGNKLGYLQATLAYGLKHPEVGVAFKQHLSHCLVDELETSKEA